MQIEFKRLTEVGKSELIELHNHPLVRRQMPLFDGVFTEADVDDFVAAKEKLWGEHGYGPWAFFVEGDFAGWGGLQPEGDDADLGLVLYPDYWGMGKALYELIIERAFVEMGFESVTIWFPPSRTRVKGILRLGFQPDGEVDIAGERFIRYRLHAPIRR